MVKKLLLLMVVSTASSMAAIVAYKVTLNGPNEPTASLGTGSGTVIFDTILNTMAININFTGLTGTTSNAHIHCCTSSPFTGTAGVATTTPSFVGFPLGVTSGTFINTLNLLDPGSYNPAFITAQGNIANAEAVLIAGAASGSEYLNIHTSAFPGGEIRGFLTFTPEPGTFGMMGGALAAAAFFRRKFRG